MIKPTISLVVPVLNETESLAPFFERVVPLLDAIDRDWEVVFVDDGSTDATADMLRDHHAQDARIKLLSFSRNFGKEAALTAGIEAARGACVIPMDVDLQDPPELIKEMVEQWRAGYQMVLATRKERKEDSTAKRMSAEWFYRVMHYMSDTSIPDNTGDFRLMDRCVVEAVKQLPERTRFMKGILSWPGFKTTQVYYERPMREAGESKFRFRSLWRLALDGLFSFSTVPLKIWTYVGAFISLVAFSYAGFLILRTLLFGADVPGYASLMAASITKPKAVLCI